MPQYRIFTNDRHPVKGVAKYSALMEVSASSPEEALKKCPPQFNNANLAPAKAIRWPKRDQTDDEKKWLKEHVL